MSGALQAVFQNQRSFGAPVPSAIGVSYGGGYYAGSIGSGSVATHYLVIGPVASAQSTLQLKTSNTSDAGATSVIDGPSNSSSTNDANHPAAQFCEALTIGGFTDWYLPAKNELDVCYFNLKPETTTNSTANGINANAIPARASNYTSGNPAQTSVADFKDTGAEDFSALYYWSSTESSAARNWIQTFINGNQYYGFKNASNLFRAVRRVAV